MGLTESSLMEKKVLVVDADQEQCGRICDLLATKNYQTLPLYSFSALELTLKETPCRIIIVDIDTIEVDNQAIKDVVLNNPGVYFLCLSKDRFHPELKDAICYHIYACVNKPVNTDELFFWLRSIYEDENSPS